MAALEGRRDAASVTRFGSSRCTALLSEPEAARDDAALHLGRARVERARQRVSDLALDRVLLHVAVAAVELQRVERGLRVHLAHEQLGDRGFEYGVLPLPRQPADLVEQEAPGF